MELTGNTFSFPWEASLMEWLQTHLSGAVPVISFLSAFGEELIMILILGFLYWWYDKKAGKAIGLSVLMGIVWNPMIKNIFLRRRPYFDHEGIRILRLVEPKADPMDIAAQGYSFPSGHSTNAAAAYGSLALALKKKWVSVLAILLPLREPVSQPSERRFRRMRTFHGCCNPLCDRTGPETHSENLSDLQLYPELCHPCRRWLPCMLLP